MELTHLRAGSKTRPITFWPAEPIEPMRADWPGMRTRDIVPIAKEGWEGFAFSEWDLTAAVWQDYHPHSEVNLVIEGELHISVGDQLVILGPGDTALVPAGALGRYWAPEYARMMAVYGPNPDGLESTEFKYWNLADAPLGDANSGDQNDDGPIIVWRKSPLVSERPEWARNRGRFITRHPQHGPWSDFILSEWELEGVGWQDRHPHVEYNIVVEGELHIETEGQTVVLRAGDSATVHAGNLAVYTAPVYARMVAVYGPNPGGLSSTDFAYLSN